MKFRRGTRRLATARLATARLATARVPIADRVFTCVAYRDRASGNEHLAFHLGPIDDGEPVLVRAHSECLTGDVFRSRRCDCGDQLWAALDAVAAAGRGVVVYLRGHEGRGIGLGAKIRAYELQDDGLDTVAANIELGLPVDDRDYAVVPRILADLGVRKVRLLTNNPAKHDDIASSGRGVGVEIVERVPLVVPPTSENVDYLRTKREKLGHVIGNVPE